MLFNICGFIPFRLWVLWSDDENTLSVDWPQQTFVLSVPFLLQCFFFLLVLDLCLLMRNMVHFRWHCGLQDQRPELTTPSTSLDKI